MSEKNLFSLVRAVLGVARLGEVDHFGWWGTRSFGPAGRVVLKQRLPRTWRMAAIELDIAAAANRHNEIIDRRNAVHLFSDNWPVRRWAAAWVAEQKTSVPPDEFFEQLETMTTEEAMSSLELAGSKSPAVNGRAVSVGSVGRAVFDSPDSLAPKVADLAAVYAHLGREFAVPLNSATFSSSDRIRKDARLG